MTSNSSKPSGGANAGPYFDIWYILATKGYVEVTVATHRVQATIETIKKRKWRQNVRRKAKGIIPYEDMNVTITKLSDAYVKLRFTIPQRYII